MFLLFSKLISEDFDSYSIVNMIWIILEHRERKSNKGWLGNNTENIQVVGRLGSYRVIGQIVGKPWVTPS